MSKQDNEVPPFIQMLAALMGSSKFVQIIPEDGQSLEDAIAAHEAEHRKSCPGCAAAYEAEQEAAKPTTTHSAEAEAAERAAAAAGIKQYHAGEAMAKDLEAGAAAPKRTPIGFMVFSLDTDGTMRAVPGSFNTDRAAVEKKLALFRQVPEVKMLMDLSKLFGSVKVETEVRPVFGE